MSTPPVSIDRLSVKKSLIDLSELPKGTFDSVFTGYSLQTVLDDVLLAEFVDESDSGTEIVRNGLVIPINADTKAWRIGKVLLTGTNVQFVKVGDHICFPNNLGTPIANLVIEGHGTLKKGVFLSEARIFGICKPLNQTKAAKKSRR